MILATSVPDYEKEDLFTDGVIDKIDIGEPTEDIQTKHFLMIN